MLKPGLGMHVTWFVRYTAHQWTLMSMGHLVTFLQTVGNLVLYPKDTIRPVLVQRAAMYANITTQKR